MRLRFSLLILAVFCASACFGAPTHLPKGIKLEQDLQYVPGGDPAQSLDLYLPERPSDKPRPLVIWIHGGGWTSGTKTNGYSLDFIPEGYAAASIEYRFSQKAVFPAQIQDCQAAIRWLRANSGKYNIDPDHIGVWGASAGGHLVALLGTAGGKNAFPPIGGNEDQSDRVQAVCDWFGPTDFNTVISQFAADPTVKSVYKLNTPGDPYSKLIGIKLGDDKAKTDAVSPIHYVSQDNPPILIMHGTKDPNVPFAQSVEFADALKAAGVDVILQRFPGSGHGSPAFNSLPARRLVHSFFAKHLKGADVKVEPLPDSEVMLSPATAPAK